jgi:hypothetical protein
MVHIALVPGHAKRHLARRRHSILCPGILTRGVIGRKGPNFFKAFGGVNSSCERFFARAGCNSGGVAAQGRFADDDAAFALARLLGHAVFDSRKTVVPQSRGG